MPTTPLEMESRDGREKVKEGERSYFSDDFFMAAAEEEEGF